MMTQSLKWSAQLHLAAGRSKHLQGDKITLPQSALEALLAAAPMLSVEKHDARRHTPDFDPFNPYSFAAEQRAREAFTDRQQQLPHPLTFRLINPKNDRVVYAGIREFSADEGTVGLSDFLVQALGIGGGTSERSSRDPSPLENAMEVDNNEKDTPVITIHAHTLPKGTYVRLRPLEAGYDAEDWKSLLERYLRDNYTTLTNGEVLDVPGARREHFKFLVDKFEPEGNGICIVDTDLEVDIEALNEEQAKETLSRRLAKAKRVTSNGVGTSGGGVISPNEQKQGQVLPGEYVDYELKIWDRHVDLDVTAITEGDFEVDILVSPFSARQRARPRLDEHVFADLSGRATKRLKLSHRNVGIEEAESLYISIHATRVYEQDNTQAIQFTLALSNDDDDSATEQPEPSHELPGPDEVQCKNCQQVVPKRALPLHEAFCYRNNVLCPKCHNVFLKNSEAWKTHWHCPHDDEYGNGELSRTKHDSVFHLPEPIRCPACNDEAFDIPTLAQHRTTVCPEKEILCQFCHLIVPQQGPEDPAFTDAEVLLSGLAPHEVTDGSRTTECHLCGKIVKLQNMKTHMKLHDRDRILRPKPKLCVNAICGRVIKAGKEAETDREHLGLCDDCFGPLHGSAYDPEGKALRRRIERRLLQQLMGGCGKEWCHNTEWCRTGRKNATGQDIVMATKDALPVVKPILGELVLGNSSNLIFCTDEASQSRKAMAKMMAAESVYELEWCVKALEESKNDAGRAQDWLKDMAPKKDETVV